MYILCLICLWEELRVQCNCSILQSGLDWKNPFDINRGWLLWGIVGIFSGAAAVLLAGTLVTYINGAPLPREVSDVGEYDTYFGCDLCLPEDGWIIRGRMHCCSCCHWLGHRGQGNTNFLKINNYYKIWLACVLSSVRPYCLLLRGFWLLIWKRLSSGDFSWLHWQSGI